MKKQARAAIVLSLMTVLTSRGLYAKEESSQNINALISFALTAEDRFSFEVRVNEGGSLYDGNQRITKGIMVYQLSVGEKKKFKIEPETGYEIKSIRLNDKMLDSTLKEVTVTGVSAVSVLEIQYGKRMDGQRPPDIDTPSAGNETEKLEGMNYQEDRQERSLLATGDSMPAGEYIGLLLIVLYWQYVRRRDINTKECVDNIAIQEMYQGKKK